MGFFDKHKRQYRQKIQDLQKDLARAEREGNYVAEQGVYFADQAEMGEMTMMLMEEDTHTEEEGSVIESFFNRNGFTVENLKLNLGKKSVSDIEMIPSNEMLVAMVVTLQAGGFKVVDDSEHDIEFDQISKICPVSGLARAVSVLFARKVNQIISESLIRITKEGSRLQTWMPAVIDALQAKLDTRIVYATEYLFDDAFNHYYNKSKESGPGNSELAQRLDGLDQGMLDEDFPYDDLFLPITDVLKETEREPEVVEKKPGPKPLDDDDIGPISFDLDDEKDPPPTPDPAPVPIAATGSQMQSTGKLTADDVYNRLCKAIVQGSSHAGIDMAGRILEQLNRYFDAKASCLLLRNGNRINLEAGAGESLVWSLQETNCVPLELVNGCANGQVAVSGQGTRGAQGTVTPVAVDGKLIGMVYLERAASFSKQDIADLKQLVKVFQDFPDLTMGLTAVR